jgi:hypothetical protein
VADSRGWTSTEMRMGSWMPRNCTVRSLLASRCLSQAVAVAAEAAAVFHLLQIMAASFGCCCTSLVPLRGLPFRTQIVGKYLDQKLRSLAGTPGQMNGVLESPSQARSTHRAADNSRRRTGG